MNNKPPEDFRRKYARAPINTEFLYSDGSDSLYKGKLFNISKNGLLLKYIQTTPASLHLDLLVSIPDFPFLNKLSSFRLKEITVVEVPHRIERLKTSIVRRYQEIDAKNVVCDAIGVTIVGMNKSAEDVIENYFTTYKENLDFILNLIYSPHEDDESKIIILNLMKLFGYKEIKNIREFQRILINQREGFNLD